MNYLFWLFILLIPSQLGKHFWPEWSLVDGVRVDYLSPTIYLTDILLFLLVTTILINHKSYIRNHILSLRGALATKQSHWDCHATPMAWLAMTGISYILFIIWQSPRSWLAIYWLLRYLEIPLVAWTVKYQISNIKYQISRGLVIGILFSVGLGVTQMILGRTTGIFWWLGERSFSVATPAISTIGIFGQQILRPYATFPHPNALAGWLAVGGLIVAIINKSKKFFSMKSHFAEIVAIFGVIMTASRTAIFGLLFGSLIFFSVGKIPPVAKAMIAFPQESIPERLILIRAAWQIFLQHPIVGVGPGQFLVYLPKYLPTGTWIIQPVHNIPLLILSEFGLAGVGMSLVCLMRLMRLMKKIWLPIIIVIAITGLGDHYWLTAQQNRLLLGVALGLIFLRRNN